jgi:hypothetical protein
MLPILEHFTYLLTAVKITHFYWQKCNDWKPHLQFTTQNNLWYVPTYSSPASTHHCMCLCTRCKCFCKSLTSLDIPINSCNATPLADFQTMEKGKNNMARECESVVARKRPHKKQQICNPQQCSFRKINHSWVLHFYWCIKFSFPETFT